MARSTWNDCGDDNDAATDHECTILFLDIRYARERGEREVQTETEKERKGYDTIGKSRKGAKGKEKRKREQKRRPQQRQGTHFFLEWHVSLEILI